MNLDHKRPSPAAEAIARFSTHHNAHKFFASMRWPNGAICPRCGSKSILYLADYKRYQCAENHPCRQFTIKTGSPMEKSHLGLDKWAIVFWIETNTVGLSSYEIHRAIGITQKSAWFMKKRIREAMQSGFFDS